MLHPERRWEMSTILPIIEKIRREKRYCDAFAQQVDLTAWKKNETTIHEHVKKGGNRHALMVFAAEYDDDNEFEIWRPIKIYYHFALYENNERVGDFMEDVIDNPSPRGYKKNHINCFFDCL
ncbi:hypothetical protein M3Y98_00876100 [Aphelenchoides besseyi]|nr:hypothetical protein M3Y98_00876100 [Aphelenchoides besseyi]